MLLLELGANITFCVRFWIIVYYTVHIVQRLEDGKMGNLAYTMKRYLETGKVYDQQYVESTDSTNDPNTVCCLLL